MLSINYKNINYKNINIIIFHPYYQPNNLKNHKKINNPIKSHNFQEQI
jgi:hypothetical protein